MKVFQFDGSCGEFNQILDDADVTPMDVAALQDLTLEQRLDALESRVEVKIDQWTCPAEARLYGETLAGTWIMQARWGANLRMDVVIAANPNSDRQAQMDLDLYCSNQGLLDDEAADDQDHQGEMTNWVAVNVEGDDSHVMWFAYFRSEPQADDFALAYEAIRLGEEVKKSLEAEPVEEQPNRLSRQLGLRRFYMGQAV